MDNWLKHQKEARQQEMDKTSAKTRIESWVQEDELAKTMTDQLLTGTIPLMHVTNYKHRTRNKEKELDSKGFLLKTYMTAKDRSLLQESRNKEFIMERDEYNPNLPFKSVYLRERDPAKEINYPLRFGLHPRLENSRIIEEIHKKTYLDHTQKNMKMVHDPDWKEPHKEKWISNQFTTTNCNFPGKKSHEPWAQIPIFLANDREKYVDGYETTGDLSRKREKPKEFKRPEFISTIRSDLWSDTLKASNSLRTCKSDDAFRVDKSFDEWSKNQKNIEYKPVLVNTRSVDHLVPFEHSNNCRGRTLRDFRPKYQKIYNQSVKELAKIKRNEAGTASLLINNKENSSPLNTLSVETKKNTLKQPSIIEENDSPLSTNSSTLRKKHKKDLVFLSKEDKIKQAIAKSFGSLI